jgi:hypothetical protein
VGDTDWLEVALEEDDREPEMEDEGETEEDRHSVDVELLVRLVLRERLSVTEAQPVAVDDADRHKVGEVDRLGVVVPVRDTAGLTDGHPDAVTDRLCVRVTAGDALALGHELMDTVIVFELYWKRCLRVLRIILQNHGECLSSLMNSRWISKHFEIY